MPKTCCAHHAPAFWLDTQTFSRGSPNWRVSSLAAVVGHGYESMGEMAAPCLNVGMCGMCLDSSTHGTAGCARVANLSYICTNAPEDRAYFNQRPPNYLCPPKNELFTLSIHYFLFTGL